MSKILKVSILSTLDMGLQAKKKPMKKKDQSRFNPIYAGHGSAGNRVWAVHSARTVSILSTLDMGLQVNFTLRIVTAVTGFNPIYAGHGSAGN